MKQAKKDSDRKTLTLKRETYFELVKIKAELQANDWEETIKKIAEIVEEHKKRKKYPALY